MNILLTIGTYNTFGGTEKVVTLMANDLVVRHPDWTVSVAAFREKCDPKKFGLSDGIPCYSLAEGADLRKILIEKKINLIINQWCLPFYVTRAINRARKGLHVNLISVLEGVPDRCKRVIVAEDQVRGSSGFRKLCARVKLRALHLVVKASIRYVYRQSDRYLVISKGFMESFRAYTGLKKTPRLDYIYPLTDYMAPDAMATSCLDHKKKQILYIGRMDKENKRVNRIVDAWAAVASDFPDWNLVLVGGGPHLDELRRDIAQRSIPRVHTTGFVPEAPLSYYRDSSIFMLTSDLEGFGLVLAEAMSYGVVPIVYASYVTAREIVDDGVNGMLTPKPYSPETTVRCLRQLMEDEGLRRRMSLAAIEKARQFSIPTIMDRWERIVSKVVK